MITNDLHIEAIVGELESQGLSVKIHSEFNHTWFIKSAGVFVGHVASSDELIELKRTNMLNINGLRSLG